MIVVSYTRMCLAMRLLSKYIGEDRMEAFLMTRSGFVENDRAGSPCNQPFGDIDREGRRD